MIQSGKRNACDCGLVLLESVSALLMKHFLASNCEVSKISGNIHIRPWMRSSRRASLEDRHADPEPRFIPMPGQFTVD